MVKLITIITTIFSLLAFSCNNNSNITDTITPGWPQTSNKSKPWSRWWWMGSNVDSLNLKKALEQYANAGLGGLEITSIYGVKGQEDKFIKFNSEQWVNLLCYTLEEAKNHDLGIDMALASGWPFGGPWVSADDACKYIQFKSYEIKENNSLNEPIAFIQNPILRSIGKHVEIEQLKDPVASNDSLQIYAFDQVRFPKKLPLITLMGYSDKGEIIELTDKVDSNGHLNWKATNGNWKLCAAFSGWHGKMVERAGPGGEGDVIDHFSKQAVNNYLKRFDNSFKSHDISGLRAFFNDSYEVDDAIGEANWTPGFFDYFQAKRGYDLKKHLFALTTDLQDINKEYKNRIVCDFRETISEILLENFTKEWQKWAVGKGKIIRNQAHGSPANILDLYAASDIPETEGTKILNIKMASSAAHFCDKKLVSAEAATWLNEHFLATLSQTKENVDRYFVGGINHVVYHGTCFSPENEPWPGRMFYASVHYAPTNPIWRDFPTLNSYVTRVQSFLQRGTVDNDILLYYPIHDEWMKPGKESILHFHGVVEGSPVYNIADTLFKTGYSFDYISDNQIIDLQNNHSSLISGNKQYQLILVPEVNYIPLPTFKKLMDLAKQGATVLFLNELPANCSGWNNLETNQKELENLKKTLVFNNSNKNLKIASIGKGKVIIGRNFNEMLENAQIKRETLVDNGLNFIRLNDGQTKTYFIANWSESSFYDWIKPESDCTTALIYNPMTGEYGKAKVNGNNKNILLQLDKGESCILQLWSEEVDAVNYKYYESQEGTINLNSDWNIEFIEGGPEIPQSQNLVNLVSWTELPDSNSIYFSGTAHYTTTFKLPDKPTEYWELDLGEVHESATVFLNNKNLGTVIGPEYKIRFESDILHNNNKLEIWVTNLMANRIIFMDKYNIEYRKFYNTNFNALLRENLGDDRKFTAKNWTPVKSGLTGIVRLIPVSIK